MYPLIHFTIKTNVTVNFWHIKAITTQQYFNAELKISPSFTIMMEIKFT